MNKALVDGQLVPAGLDAPKTGDCPGCGWPVELRQRQGTWFWRHKPGAPRDCPARGNPNGREKTLNQPTYPIDSALADNLAEVCEMLSEVGAEGIWVLRGVGDVEVSYVAGGERLTLALADAGLILVARFPASDGGEAGVESR